MQFADLVGGPVLLQLPRIHPAKYHEFTLHGVEPGGLWVESQEVVNAVLRAAGAPVAPKTALLFFPFHEISLALASIDKTALDEKAFGL